MVHHLSTFFLGGGISATTSVYFADDIGFFFNEPAHHDELADPALYAFVLVHLSSMWTTFLLQVDYESDDDNEVDDEIADEEEAALYERDSEAPATQDELCAPSSCLQAQNKKQDLDGLALHRISAVQESHDAIESYVYDLNNELWCEVRL